MTLLTQTTQVSETVFANLSCACSNSQSSHLSPKCFPILLIRTKGVLPTLFRMFGRIFGGSGLEQTQSQCIHRRLTQQPHSIYCFLFQPAFSFTRLVILATSVLRNIHRIQTHNIESLIQKTWINQTWIPAENQQIALTGWHDGGGRQRGVSQASRCICWVCQGGSTAFPSH